MLTKIMDRLTNSLRDGAVVVNYQLNYVSRSYFQVLPETTKNKKNPMGAYSAPEPPAANSRSLRSPHIHNHIDIKIQL